MLQTRSKLDAQMLLPEWEQTLAHFLRHPVTIRLKDLLAQRQALSCSGLLPSARMLLALACWRDSTTPVLWLTSSSESAERLTADLKTVLRGEFSGCPLHFPEQEEGEGAHIDPIRLGILDQLDHGSCGMIVSSLRALLQTVLSPEQLKRSRFELKKGELVDRDTIIELLSEEGYTRVGMVERRAEFSLRGGILDIYPRQSALHYRGQQGGRAAGASGGRRQAPVRLPTPRDGRHLGRTCATASQCHGVVARRLERSVGRRVGAIGGFSSGLLYELVQPELGCD
jgi:hypothetical protein